MKSELGFALENADWPVLVVDDSTTIRRANDAAIGLFGAGVESEPSLSAAIWSTDNDMRPEQFLNHLDRTAESLAYLKLRVKGGTASPFATHICPFTRDGQKFFLFQMFPPAPAALGEPSTPPRPLSVSPLKDTLAGRSLAESRPATDAPSIEAALAQKQKLECALQLARTVALDFNNALTSILGFTSLILSKMELDHPWRTAMLEVERSAEKAAEVANHLVSFSRQDKDPGAVAAGNLNDVLKRTVDLFQTCTAERIRWALQFEARPFAAQFDEAKLQQAFVKILENAVESIPAAGSIALSSRNLSLNRTLEDGTARVEPGNHVCVEITDSGCGIEPAVLPRVFEPFFTTKRDPKHRGLGLAWVYGIVTNHGGSVALTSLPGQGTAVRVYLPALKKHIKAGGLVDGDLTGEATVLIVDDEPLVLTMGETVLSAYGYRVLTATNGLKALEIISAGLMVDLVITDLVMPGMSGRELMTQLRQLAPGVRILCMSGFVRGSPAEEDEAYLQKPFTSQDLLRKVKQVLAPAEAG